MEIKTIKETVSNTIIIEKSKFISILFPCFSKKEAESILDDLHGKYPDATHICYAYIINDEVLLYKSSDDGEPSQTAGAPILNCLQRKELINVLLVVIRYFGGIKLGAGGLTRAYSNSASSVVELASITTLMDANRYELYFEYDKTKEIDELLRINKIDVESKSYDDKVHYYLVLKDGDLINKLIDKKDYYNYQFDFKETIKIAK